MLSEKTCNRLRKLTNDELRAIKIRTSEAKVGTHDHNLFKFVDRLLLEREWIREHDRAKARGKGETVV